MNHFEIPDIVLPSGHQAAPWPVTNLEVRVKFSPSESHVDYLSWQIWFEYPITANELKSINERSSVRYINHTTHIHHKTGKPWTPHSCYYNKNTGDATIRYWAGSLLNGDKDFVADTPKMFIKQVVSLITKGRKIYPKKKPTMDYSI